MIYFFLALLLFHAGCVVFYYLKILRCVPCRCRGNMEGKTVLITGATSGIGLQTAITLACQGARIILTSRSISKGIIAQNRIIAASKNTAVSFRLLELTSFASVRSFASQIIESETRIDVLINNAGVADVGNYVTDDGVVAEAQINYYSHFLVTKLLLDLMKKSAPSRIINVSSWLHRWGRIHPAMFDHPVRGYWARKRMFANCKLATILFTMKLSRELRGTGVTANCFSPGLVYTQHWGQWSFLSRFVIRRMMRKAEDGAQSAVHLAMARKLKTVSGRYFEDCDFANPSLRALDSELADRLWRSSERVVGLTGRFFYA